LRSAWILTRDGSLAEHLRQSLVHHGFAVRVCEPQSLFPAGLAGADLHFYDLGPRRDASDEHLERLILSGAAGPWVALVAVPGAGQGLRLLGAGARGYVNRMMSAAVLELVIETVLAGRVWAGQEVTDYLLEQSLTSAPVKPDAGAALDTLTAREREIAEAVAVGKSNKVIAAESGVTERTVKAHLNAVYRKTGIRNRVQLALAWREGQGRSLAG